MVLPPLQDFTTPPSLENWQIRAQTRKQKQLDSIPPEWRISAPENEHNVLRVPYECGLLTPLEIEITDTLDVEVILSNLRSGLWSSVGVTTAFYKRALIAHQVTNCLTEIFVERALARAREMDEYLAEHKRPKGPLHGLPVSLKDQFTIKGLETINGYVANIGEFAAEDCVLVQLLIELGAVPFTRTNVPQTLMWGETYNNVFGRTLNPYDRELTPGGSSGGEGALIAMQGSPLGVGTDIGGSIRIPASICGIYGLRPSSCRLPYHGVKNTLDGQESVMSVLGPMCNSLSGLKIFTKAIIDTRPWILDPMCIRMVWDQAAYELVEHGGRGGKKCFAMLYDDGLFKPHPPMFRAMNMMRKALEAAGHEVIEWENHKHKEIFFNIDKQILVADGGEDFSLACALSGEPLIKSMDPDLYSHESYSPMTNKGVAITEPLSAWQLWQLHKEKRDLRKSYIDHWQSTISQTTTGRPIDAVISPVIPYAAGPHGKQSSGSYTAIWNALDYTVGVIPVTFVNPELDKPAPPHEFYSEKDRYLTNQYNPKVYQGAPVGLQIVGQRLEEEAVLAMMEEVDEALRSYKAQHSLV